jgi:hypothetical protein
MDLIKQTYLGLNEIKTKLDRANAAGGNSMTVTRSGECASTTFKAAQGTAFFRAELELPVQAVMRLNGCIIGAAGSGEVFAEADISGGTAYKLTVTAESGYTGRIRLTIGAKNVRSALSYSFSSTDWTTEKVFLREESGGLYSLTFSANDPAPEAYLSYSGINYTTLETEHTLAAYVTKSGELKIDDNSTISTYTTGATAALLMQSIATDVYYQLIYLKNGNLYRTTRVEEGFSAAALIASGVDRIAGNGNQALLYRTVKGRWQGLEFKLDDGVFRFVSVILDNAEQPAIRHTETGEEYWLKENGKYIKPSTDELVVSADTRIR